MSKNCTKTDEVIALLTNYPILEKKKKLDIISEEEEKVFNLISSSLLILNNREYEVISKTYLDNEDCSFNYMIQHELRLSERTYYRLKENALIKMYNFLPQSLFEVV